MKIKTIVLLKQYKAFGFNVPFLIAYHLNCYKFIVLVVQTFQDLPKGAFPDHFKYFKPVANVIM